ncbi:MAG: hypothetical protein RLZZ292_3902 [Bacteroidota bacterium]
MLINHALVTLTVDGKTEALTQFTKGVYGTLNLKLVDNQIYTLYVKDSITGREATATTQFIAPIKLDTAIAKLEVDKALNDTVLTINLEFTDNPSQKNYYLVDYIPSKKKKEFSFFGLTFSNSTSTLFTDDAADANHKIKINKSLLINPTDTFTVTLFNITKEYYDYQNAYKRREGFIAQLTAEPISLPTNVKNGQGFFNMSYPSLRQVVREVVRVE